MDSSENLDFTSYVASNLKDVFDTKFNHYKNQLNKMESVAPKAISTHLEATV